MPLTEGVNNIISRNFEVLFKPLSDGVRFTLISAHQVANKYIFIWRAIYFVCHFLFFQFITSLNVYRSKNILLYTFVLFNTSRPDDVVLGKYVK